jgi:hypothetical protein
LEECNLKTMSFVFFLWMKTTNRKLKLVTELLAPRCFNGAENFASNMFLYLVCFVVLQVMTKGVWWVSCWDGMQFL